MALRLLDLLLPGRRDRVARFVNGPAAPFTYLAHVGAGGAAARFAPERRGDLWSGVALAASYARGAGADALRRVRHEARGYESEIAQAAAFAVAARPRGNNGDRDTDEACEVLTGAKPGHVAGLVRALQPREARGDGAGASERWRTSLRLSLAPAFASPPAQVAV